jgi:hypothetical protein
MPCPVSRLIHGHVLLFFTMLGLPGCTRLYDDRCGVETRSVQSSAELLSSEEDTVVRTVLDVGETREDGSRSVHWTIFYFRLPVVPPSRTSASRDS